MEVEVRKYKGVILDLEGVTVYRVKLYDADKKATIDLLNVDPKEIKIIQ